MTRTPAPDAASVACNVFLEYPVSYPFFLGDTGIHSTKMTQLFFYLLSPEQGHRNDLSRGVAVCKNPPSDVAFSHKIRPTDIHHISSPPLILISDSVHCNPYIHHLSSPPSINRLTAIGFWQEQKLSLSFLSDVGISIKKFAVGILSWS